MCCIIHRPKDAKEISNLYLESIIKVNPDGWGLSYKTDKGMQVVKSLNMSDAIKRIRDLEKENIEFVFHARWATHGKTNVENCHPFNLSAGLLYHNGKINVHCRNRNLSDTYHFGLKVSKFLRKGKTIESIINKFKSIVGFSRFAYVADDGTVTRFGDWHELDGCYYSKLNWKYKADYSDSCYPYGGNYYNVGNNNAWKQGKDWFKEALELCTQKIPNLYKYVATELTDRELITIAINYPEICADYILKHNDYLTK